MGYLFSKTAQELDRRKYNLTFFSLGRAFTRTPVLALIIRNKGVSSFFIRHFLTRWTDLKFKVMDTMIELTIG